MEGYSKCHDAVGNGELKKEYSSKRKGRNQQETGKKGSKDEKNKWTMREDEISSRRRSNDSQCHYTLKMVPVNDVTPKLQFLGSDEKEENNIVALNPVLNDSKITTQQLSRKTIS